MYTYDLATSTGKMRLLLGDNSGEADAFFQDEELQGILQGTAMMLSGPRINFAGASIPQQEILLLACANAMEALASKAAINSNDIKIGSLMLNDRFKVTSMQAQADRFRAAVDNVPAWGIVEENSCGFNELTIIRNWVLRTEM